MAVISGFYSIHTGIFPFYKLASGSDFIVETPNGVDIGIKSILVDGRFEGNITLEVNRVDIASAPWIAFTPMLGEFVGADEATASFLGEVLKMSESGGTLVRTIPAKTLMESKINIDKLAHFMAFQTAVRVHSQETLKLRYEGNRPIDGCLMGITAREIKVQ